MMKIIRCFIFILIMTTMIQVNQNYVVASEKNVVYDECYGNQLNGKKHSRQIYDTMVENYVYQKGTDKGLAKPVNNDDTSFTIVIPKIEDTVKSVDNEVISKKITDLAASKISPAVTAAFDSFLKDYPEVYWMNSIQYSIGASISTNYSSETTKIIINEIQITTCQYCDGLLELIPEFNEAIAGAVDTISKEYSITELTSDEEVVKAIHDYVSGQVDYNQDAALTGPVEQNTYSYTPLPVFLGGSYSDKVICEGYAKAFEILANRFGLESTIVIGNSVNQDGALAPHMWNAVRLEDKNWYAVDVTWDDQDSEIFYNYFLAGMETKGFYMLYKEDHVASGRFSDYTYSKEFAVPEVCQQGYDSQRGNSNDFIGESTTIENKSIIKEDKQDSVQEVDKSSTVEDTKEYNRQPEQTVLKKNQEQAEKTESAKTVKEPVEKVESEEKAKVQAEKTESAKTVKVQKVTIAKVNKVYKLKKGKSVRPKVTIKYKGKKLKKGKDYTVTYKNNKKKGTGKIIIKGKGKYKGTKIIKFKIR